VTRLGLSALVLGSLVACKSGDDDDVRFNAEDVLIVEIGPEIGADVSTDLLSTSGTIVIGTATISPGSGPVGTVHSVSVVVAEEFEELVSRADVVTDASERGVETIALVQDSADHGLWWREVVSVGVEGEVRSDTFTFNLFTPAEDSDTNGILP
jgi:hypothetical protein